MCLAFLKNGYCTPILSLLLLPFPLAYLLFSYLYLLYEFELDSENPLLLNLLSHF